MDTFSFFIPTKISKYMHAKMIEGQSETYIRDEYKYFGTERGGNLNFIISDDKITATSVNDSALMPETSSLNTGDYPFTFHTHPILSRCKIMASGGTRRRKRKGGMNASTKKKGQYARSTRTVKNKPYTSTTYICVDYKIDNYPNLISDEDLVGCVEDNIVSNIKSERNICGSTHSTIESGISIFDIVAVPYGLFIYRPSSNFLSKRRNSMERGEQFIKQQFNAYKNTILPNYNYQDRDNYKDAQLGNEYIVKYIKKLEDNGFIINFFRWEDAMANEISFTLDNITEDMITRITECIDTSI